MKLTRTGKGLLLCYALFLALWLLLGLAAFAVDRAFGEQPLPPESLHPVNLTPNENGSYTAENEDPQLIYEGELTARWLLLTADFSGAPGEMALYYATKPGQGFSANHVVYAQPLEGGRYLYTLRPGRYTALRLDPGTLAGNEVTIESVTLNPAAPLWRYLVPSLRGALGLVLLPPLAYCGICFIMDLYIFIKERLNQRKGNPNA